MRDKNCEICGAELPISRTELYRVKADDGKFQVEIITGFSWWNQGNMCADCVVKAIKDGKDMFSQFRVIGDKSYPVDHGKLIKL